MTNIKLVTSVFRSHITRTVFTMLSVAVAFAILLVLSAMSHGITGLTSNAQAQRLIILGKSGSIPLNYAAKITAIPGVVAVDYQAGFSGWIGDRHNWIYAKGVPFEDHMRVNPDFQLSEAEYRAMLADRRGAIACAPVAKKMGWNIGDTIRLQDGLRQEGGNTTWTFKLAGIFTSTQPEAMQQHIVVHYDYINEGRTDLINRDKIGNITVLADDARNIGRVARAIDERFAHAQPTTQTLPEQLLAAAVVKSFGDVTAILIAIASAVFTSMLLVAGNTVAGSVRERMNAFALMRALGFSRARLAGLVLIEAGLLIGSGASLGIVLGWQICAAMTPVIGEMLPYFMVTWQTLALAVLLAIGFALLTGFLPARSVTMLDIADSLRRI